MEVFSTRSIPRHAKIDYWNDVSSRMFTRLEVAPSDREAFEGVLCGDALGPILIAKVRSSPARIRRTQEDVSNARPDSFQIQLAVDGSFQVSQAEREIVLNAGDFNISDPSLPLDLSHFSPCSTIILTVPADFMRRYLPFPERLVGLRMAHEKNINRIPSSMIQNLWQQLQHGGLQATDAKLAEILMEAIAAAYGVAQGSVHGPSAIAFRRKAAIKHHIETHLRDPRLTPNNVAKAVNISPRYMRNLFSDEDETVSGYILRRRLEASARELAELLWRRKTISEIAFSWGFNNTTHFSRVFRDRYRMSPRQFRELHSPL